MNTRKITSLICCFTFAGFATQTFAFSNQDAAITATETIPESCSLSAGTEGLTQTILETGGSDLTEIFGTYTTSCNSASGFKYQLSVSDDTCAFDNATSHVYWNLPTTAGNSAAVNTGAGYGPVSETLVSACPTGFATLHIVSGGSVYNGATIQLKPYVNGIGVGNLLEGAYSDTVTLRLSDV